MLRSWVLEYGGSWDTHLPLIEFAYNITYHSSIGMPPYEMMYGRKCRTPTCWLKDGEKQFAGPELLQIIAEKVAIAREKLKAARDRHGMKCKVDDETQLVPLSDLKVDLNQKLVEDPVKIVDIKVTKLRKKEIRMVLIEWKHSL
ncbi:uncharacterized protein [Rutidosis leptorrhynchoides]|uniref:uncharacterized protein n=1 Tax=Rutidosis leptorrhynchoides TaxID=125765 RepID=UPI003A9925B8